MQRNRSLPTERGGAPAPIPQHIQYEGQQSNESTGSQDSVMTQIPLPYHLPTEGSQEYAYGAGAQLGGASPWATPILSQSGGFEVLPGAARGLNPNSSPYVPAGYLPQHVPNVQGQQLQGQQLQGQTQWQAENAMAQAYQQQGGQIGMSQYQNANPYNQNNMPLGGPVGGAAAQFQSPYGQQQQCPYPQYGSGAPPMNPYNQYSSAPSPAASYATMTSPAQSYQNIPYGPGTGNGIAPPPPQNWGAQYGGNASIVGSGRPQFNGSSNIGRKVNANSRKGASAFANKSNLATAPVRNVNSPNPKHSSNTTKQGGPVQDTAKTGRPASRSESVGTGRGSSAGPQSRTSEEINRGPTPGSQPRALDVDFSSEPRNSESRQPSDATPQLRSRRKQSTASLNEMPLRGRDTTSWFAETAASLEQLTLNDDAKRIKSPPKMLSLLAAGGLDASILSPITETDNTFTAGPPTLRRAYNDPFGPTPAMSTPYTGSTLLAPPHGMSNPLRVLTSNGTCKPSIQEALDPRNLPFSEYCRQGKEDQWGVIKIKNIPYSVNRSEVMAFLGRNARIINENEHEPVHIVMERVTSKTLDCYVEFINFNEAVNAVNRFETNRTGGRGGRLGQRHVEVELSSQEALMKDLFPKAKNVKWRGGKPEIIPRDPHDIYNSGFQGFVSKEELVMLVKHVEAPQRSPFSKDCPQRPFECLISTLLKYPWYMVDCITIEDRNLLHKATKDLLLLLAERVNDETDSVNLTQMLLKRVWRAAIRCPGFTPAMKDDIVYICGVDDRTAVELGLAPYAPHWKYLWTIGPKAGAPADLLLWYIALIRETTEKREVLSLAEQAARGEVADEQKLFGDLDKHVHYGPNLLLQSLAQVAKAEWAAIEKILRQALTPAIEG